MRRPTFIFWALALFAGCTDYTGPSVSEDVYALARVGAAHLPISLPGNGTAPFLVADTFRLVRNRARTAQQILRQTTVTSDGPGGKTDRTDTEFIYRIENGTLIYDNCPIGANCFAGLVYAPRLFQITGDSLFELTPLGASIPPHVYGLVRYP
jgi:hypothetical protein